MLLSIKIPHLEVRRVYFIDPTEPESDNDQRETVKLPTVYDELTTSESFTEQLAFTLRETAGTAYAARQTPEHTVQVAQFVAKMASKTVIELGKQVKTFNATKDEKIRKVVHTSIVD